MSEPIRHTSLHFDRLDNPKPSTSQDQPQDEPISEQQPQDESVSEQQSQGASIAEQQPQGEATDTLLSQSSDDDTPLPDYATALKTFTTKDPGTIPKKLRYSLRPKTDYI